MTTEADTALDTGMRLNPENEHIQNFNKMSQAFRRRGDFSTYVIARRKEEEKRAQKVQELDKEEMSKMERD